MIPSDALTKLAQYLPTPSRISHHGEPCCQRALAWLHGVDAVNSYRDAHWYPPTWLRKKYQWGPVTWPLYWCSIPEMERLDCGALSDVAVQLYRLRGQRAVGVQLILRYPQHVLAQWSRMWERAGLSPDWIAGEFCYHEACGVVEGAHLVLWDPTENRYLDPPVFVGETFASVVALKVADPVVAVPETLYWGGIPIRYGVWQSLILM
mgnify:CR=1 FL=1